jgi:hypothetical protein
MLELLYNLYEARSADAVGRLERSYCAAHEIVHVVRGSQRVQPRWPDDRLRANHLNQHRVIDHQHMRPRIPATHSAFTGSRSTAPSNVLRQTDAALAKGNNAVIANLLFRNGGCGNPQLWLINRFYCTP